MIRLSPLHAPALVAAALLAVPSFAAAQVTVADGWVRPPPPGAPTAAGYVTLTNDGHAPDALLGGASPVARAVQAHSMSMTGGIMRMRRLDALPLPPGAPVRLQPGGDHLMLVGLTGPLKPGARVPVTLRFAHARPVTVLLPVRAEPPR